MFTHKHPISRKALNHYSHPHSPFWHLYRKLLFHFVPKPHSGRGILIRLNAEVVLTRCSVGGISTYFFVDFKYDMLPFEIKKKINKKCRLNGGNAIEHSLYRVNKAWALGTLGVAADVVLGRRKAVSVFTPLWVRNSVAAGRLFILLHTQKQTKRQMSSDMQSSHTNIHAPAQRGEPSLGRSKKVTPRRSRIVFKAHTCYTRAI